MAYKPRYFVSSNPRILQAEFLVCFDSSNLLYIVDALRALRRGGGVTCTACSPGFFAANASSDDCKICGGDTFAAANGSATCSRLSPGQVGAGFVNEGAKEGATREVPCPAGTRVRSSLVGLNMISVCESCANNTVSVAASSSCTPCLFGSYSNKNRTTCLELNQIKLVTLSGNTTSDNDNLVGRAVSAAAEGKFGGQSAALAFFSLLGICAFFIGIAAALYRRRQRRLQALAIEREFLLEAAEAELATGRPMRRATLYALAGMDAEAASLGGGGGGFGVSIDVMRRKSAAPDLDSRNRTRTMAYKGDSGGGGRGGKGSGNGGGDRGDADGMYTTSGGGRPNDFHFGARRGSAPSHEYHKNKDNDKYMKHRTEDNMEYRYNGGGGGGGGGGGNYSYYNGGGGGLDGTPGVAASAAVFSGPDPNVVDGYNVNGSGNGNYYSGVEGSPRAAHHRRSNSNNWEPTNPFAEEDAAHANANANAAASARAGTAYYHRQSPAPATLLQLPPPTVPGTEDIFLSDTTAAAPPLRHHTNQYKNNNTSTAAMGASPASNGSGRYSYHQTPPPLRSPPRQQQQPAADDRLTWSP